MPVAAARASSSTALGPVAEGFADSNRGTSSDIESDPCIPGDRPPGDRQRHRHPRRRDYARGRRVGRPRRPGRAALLLAAQRPRSRSRSSAGGCSSPGASRAAFAIGFGYALATLFARRIRRLETAAERIAGGRFDERWSMPPRTSWAARTGIRAHAAAACLASTALAASSSPTRRTSCARRCIPSAGFSSCSTSEEIDATPGRSSWSRCGSRCAG